MPPFNLYPHATAAELAATDTFVALVGGVTKEVAVATVAGAPEPYQNHGNTGSTETVDVTAGTVHRAVLDAATVTFTFTGAVSGTAASFTLLLVQDATGGRLAAWPGAVDWAGGTAPTLSTAANARDVLTFLTVDGGTVWYGSLVGLGFS
jgi:hypothetical protein